MQHLEPLMQTLLATETAKPVAPRFSPTSGRS